MSDAYATVHIPKSLPIHGMALTSTGRKIEHSKVVVGAQTYKSNGSVSLKNWGLSCLRGVAVLLEDAELDSLIVMMMIIMTMDLYLLPVNNDKLLSLPLLPLHSHNKGEEDTEKRM